MHCSSHALQCSADRRGIGAIEFIGPWFSKNTLCLPELTLYKNAKPTAVSRARVAIFVRG